ncbi:hypothetical protein MRX96_009556 [Rhipicephalus microplus]
MDNAGPCCFLLAVSPARGVFCQCPLFQSMLLRPSTSEDRSDKPPMAKRSPSDITAAETVIFGIKAPVFLLEKKKERDMSYDP